MVLPTVGWTWISWIWVFCKYNLEFWHDGTHEAETSNILCPEIIVESPEVLLNKMFGGSRDAYEMIMILVPETLCTVSLRVRRERNTWHFAKYFFASGATGVASFVAAVGCSSDEVWKSLGLGTFHRRLNTKSRKLSILFNKLVFVAVFGFSYVWFSAWAFKLLIFQL